MTAKPKTIRLPLAKMKIELAGDGEKYEYDASAISSNLRDADADEAYFGAMHGIETMVLTHAIYGVNVEDPAYIRGLEAAIEACRTEL